MLKDKTSILWWIQSKLPEASGAALPYGVVMASGGAGHVADLLGLHYLNTVLTGIAVIQAGLILTGIMVALSSITIPRWRFGLFTIPLGLAVVARNLQSMITFLGHIALGLSWVITLTLSCWFFLIVCSSKQKLGLIDGTWFLAPATLFGITSATVSAAGPTSIVWNWLAVITCLVGVGGYILVVIISGVRLYYHELDDSPLTPWWIAAGCSGLAAATLGGITNTVLSSNINIIFEDMIVVTWVVGTILLIIVVSGNVWYMIQCGRDSWSPVWTPVFSTAVYAAGTDSLAQLSHMTWVNELGMVTAIATLAMWAFNSALFLYQSEYVRWLSNSSRE